MEEIEIKTNINWETVRTKQAKEVDRNEQIEKQITWIHLKNIQNWD